MKSLKKNIIALSCMAVLMTALAVQPATAGNLNEDPTFESISVDLFLLRPLGFAVTALGCAVFTVTLPFTMWSQDNLDTAGQGLVVVPGEYTFVRPLGDNNSSGK